MMLTWKTTPFYQMMMSKAALPANVFIGQGLPIGKNSAEKLFGCSWIKTKPCPKLSLK
jgi:hypothetical protein